MDSSRNVAAVRIKAETMAPVSVLEYVIVHELAVLKYKRHDSLLWNEVDRVMPEYQKQVSWLRHHGASLTL